MTGRRGRRREQLLDGRKKTMHLSYDTEQNELMHALYITGWK
jgi:hypothetical protein